ncbi:MAG: sensor histidine kinase [Chloroflexia bacterium]
MNSLRARLIISYVVVLIPALLLATLVYLGRSEDVKTQDAYRQLQTGMYLVAPQIETAVLRQRIVSAIDDINTKLVGLSSAANAGPPAKAKIAQAVGPIQLEVRGIETVLRNGLGMPNRVRIAVASGRIRTQLAPLAAAISGTPAASSIDGIRGDLLEIEDPLGQPLDAGDRVSVQQATGHIQTELQATRFRLWIVRPDGTVLLDSLGGAANMAGKGQLGGLPAGLAANPAVPVQGKLNKDAAGQSWIYEAAAARILLSPVGAGDQPSASARPPAFYMLLAQRPPDLSEVAATFVSQFLFFGLAAVLASLALGLVIARSLTRPIATLTAATREIAQGNYAHKAPVTGSSEMQALAVDFNQMASEVERTHQAQREFLANVSHDLKTPLTSISGFSGAMLDGALRDPQAFRDAAQVINAEAARMARLVADVVDLARLQGGESELELHPTDIAGLLQQAASSMRPQASERQVELRVEAGPVPLVPADGDRLRRAITNLLDNGLRHTPPGGRVTLAVEPHADGARISVRDTGPGIQAEELARIFDRFYQVDKSRAPQGQSSGLGLAIVREIVAAHGGTVGVQSTQGAGTEFVILLPGSAEQKPLQLRGTAS